MITLGRNDPCRCGSGKKYKKCHLEEDEARERKQLAKAAFKPSGAGNAPAGADSSRKGWLKNIAGKIGLLRKNPGK